MCKKEHPQLASSFSFCWLIPLVGFQELYRDNMLFFSDLVIDARESSILTRKLQWGTTLTKPKETIPNHRPDTSSMPIVISSDLILHIIPRLMQNWKEEEGREETEGWWTGSAQMKK